VFTFYGETEDAARLEQRIRGVLDRRQAVCMGELLMRLGGDGVVVRAALERMMEHGEIERLSPLDCRREDYEFFRVNRPVKAGVESEDAWVSRIAQSAWEHERLAGKEAMACLAD
jgi:hypothetical protein